MEILRKKKGYFNIRLIILVFAILAGMVAALLYFPPIPTETKPKKTSGDITFTDSGGNRLNGTIEMGGAGISGGQQENVNFVSWTNVPNARISYNALYTKNLAVDFRISGDSPKGRVILENHGITVPGGVNVSAPGTPLKYVEIGAFGVSFVEASISIQYTDAELNGLDENILAIYRYDNVTQSWSELLTSFDAANNILSATVDMLSVFAVSTRIPDKIEVHDTSKKPVVSDVKTYDEAKKVKKADKTYVLSTLDVPDRGELEVDALASKNVAVRLKVNKATKGEIILDDFGKKNPVSVPLPGRAVKYVEIGAKNISFSSANITIRYSDEELNGGAEQDLTIYHWNGASWEVMPTIIDTVNKTLSTTTTSLSSFGVATTVTYRYLPSTGATVATGVTTNFNCPGTYPTTYSKALLTTASTGGCAATRQYGNNLDPALDTFYNTSYTNDTNVTGNWVYGRMRDGTSGGGTFTFKLIYVYPNGTIVTLPGTPGTKTIGSGTSADYNVSLSGMSGVIPAGAKLGLRVSLTGSSTELRWYVGDTAAAGNASGVFSVTETPVYYNISGYVKSASGSPLSGATVQTNTSLSTTTNATGFYNFGGLSSEGYTVNASLTGYVTNSTNVTISSADVANANITLSSLGGALPNLTSWGNNKTNNQASSITLNTSEGVRFNATANQSITTWNWYVDDNNQNNNLSTFNTSWGTIGSYHVDVNATNSNGTSNTINWTVRVATNVTVQGEITDHDLNPLVVYHETEDEDDEPIESGTGSTYNYIVPIGGHVTFNASTTKNVSANFTIQGASANSKVILDDYGASNPTSSAIPGVTVKYVNISAYNLNFSEVEVKIYYTNAELGGVDENALVIYHWNGASWVALPTTVDAANNVLTATTASLSPFGVATRFIYYLENNATIQSVGFDGNTSYNASGTTVPLAIRPYENLLMNGTMGASNNIGFTTTSTTTQYWLFSFYLPVNYSVNTRISANTTFNLSWDAANANNVVNVSLIDYDPANGAKIVIGNRSFTATGGTTLTNYSYQINHSAYTVPEDHRLLFRINTTTPTTGTVYLYFNDYASNITVVETALGYNLSGRVTDTSGGSPLSGATVMTNTSLSTTTNSTGYYNFTGISNGTYLVNASLTGYVTNSTIAAINGANVANANISLSRGYLLSGNVTNATSGAAISGATVTTNTSQTTSTNATGYYNFTLSNGTYLITATMTGYSDNSTTQTINGANVTNVNISLTGVTSVSGKIRVATNRFVVLDDPNDAGAQVVSGSGFQSPSPNDWGSRSTVWAGKATTINATAMYIDDNGFPVSGKVINFTLYWPNGTALTTVKDTTNSRGLANFSYNLDNKNFYGRWNIRAENSSIGSNTSFIYNWWGCSWSGGTCGNQHSGATPPAGGSANSPYLSGRNYDTGKSQHTSHGADWTNSATNACTHCHQSFDNNTGDAYTARYNNTPADVHRNISCDNANCHGDYTAHNSNQLIYSCYNSGCHGNASAWDRKDISNKSTLDSGTVSTAVSIYSYNNASTFNATFHTPNSTVPCIICHGPMHNISKPDLSTRFIRNNNTEDSQCKTCHSSYTEHNSSNTTSGGVNCTLCHSDDVHDIQVFAQNATYVDLNRASPNPARGNCTTCHQDTTIFTTLKNQPKAGNYSGRNPPQVAVPLEHSNDPTAGAKWNQNYWTSSQQITWCIYCHSNTTHSTVALGRPASWDGNNRVNSTIGNTTWCSSCHWQGYANGSSTYNDMVNAFTGAGLPIPPEISGNAAYGANTSIYEYTNHSGYTGFSSNLNDSTCNRCHGYKYGFTTITQLMHNQTRVGGANCADCHDIGGIALLAHVNVTTANDTGAIHKNLSKNAPHVLNTTIYYENNLRCWACHGNGSEPSTPNAHPATYKVPDNCTDCHIQSATQNFNFTPNNTLLNVSEHYWNGTDIHTPAISACYACHNRSEMLIAASDPDTGSGAVYGGANGGNNSTSHYGKKRPDLRTGISANCSYCHQNESTAFSVAMLDPAYNRSINNHSLRYSSSNPNCTQCHNTGWIHNSTLTRTTITIPNSTFCINCHGMNSTTGLINFTGAVTSIKQLHNNTINCTECHLGSSRDIHPAKYLQPNASYNTSNSTAVNCINCHQNLTVYPGLSRAAPKVPNPMYHSDNAANGTLWNTTGYWTNNTLTSCTYCHNDTKHNTTAMGRPAYWKGNNVVNSSITSTSNWCAGCHYRGYSSGSKAYNDMTSTFTTANLPVPPEITNWSYAPYSFQRYYNHSLTNYTDAGCRSCHGTNISSSGRMTAFVHNITWGSCTACHYSFAAMNLTTRPDRYVNSTMFNASPHGGVACSNCHTKGHKNIGARKACEDCHAYQQVPLSDRNRHNITGSPGSSVVTNTDCTSCHDATPYNNAISNYGYNRTFDCDYCHTYPDKDYS